MFRLTPDPNITRGPQETTSDMYPQAPYFMNPFLMASLLLNSVLHDVSVRGMQDQYVFSNVPPNTTYPASIKAKITSH